MAHPVILDIPLPSSLEGAQQADVDPAAPCPIKKAGARRGADQRVDPADAGVETGTLPG
jgi:hypothetical protein